jgi:AraC-like DNA-binding protein
MKKEKWKTFVTDRWKVAAPGLLAAFAVCFIFFIYAPLELYVTNQTEFWFDFYKILKAVLQNFALFFGLNVLGILLADIGLHKELRPFRQDKGLLMALLADMYENIPVIKKDKPSDLNITQKLLQYINDNITGELTAQKVAKELGISPYYLSHIFSSQLNISFPSYVAQQRMILACNLLKDSRKTVTEISYECGFPNMRTFHRCFQKRYECTPTQWRERSHKGTDEKIRHQLWNQEKVESENSLE